MVPNGKPSAVPRSQGFHERFQSDRLIQIEPFIVSSLSSCAIEIGRDVQRFAHREQADGDDDDVDAVEQLGNAEREPRLARLAVEADEPDREADEEARQPAHGRRAEHGRHRGEGQHHDREVFGGAELQREIHHERRHHA